MASGLAHRVTGKGRPTLVLLHPISMRQAFWAPVANLLAGEMTVVTVDLRGHGDSPGGTEPFAIDDLVEDVAALLARLDLGPYLPVGCSLGGMVALGLAVRAPDRLVGAVLADTTHVMGQQGAEIMRERARNSRKGLATTVEGDLERWFTADFRASRPDVVDAVRGWVLANDAGVVANGWEAIAGLAYRDALSGVDLPILVTTGEFDPASPPNTARATAAAPPNAHYREIAGAGHFAPLEKSETFAALVRDFASELRERPAG